MSERIYRRLLKLYPASFRATYGEAMIQHFRDQCRDAKNSNRLFSVTRFWFAILSDTLIAATRQRLSKQRQPKPNTTSDVMKKIPSFRFLLAAFFVPLMAAVILNLSMQPRTFMAMSRALIDQKNKQPAGYDPYFFQTQVEIMKSDSVLGPVVAELRLAKSMAEQFGIKTKFSDPDAIEMLRGQIQFSQSRNTSLLEIRAYSESPFQAASIANKIPDVYAARNPNVEISIIDLAQPSFRPIRPNVPLILMAGAFGSALLSAIASALLRFLLRKSFARTAEFSLT
jgi:capsular polysaccharide biosynthesis protein